MATQVTPVSIPTAYPNSPDVTAWTGDQWVWCSPIPDTTQVSTMPGRNDDEHVNGTPSEVVSERDWTPAVHTDEGTIDKQATKDRWLRRYGHIWFYWIITPDQYLGAVHDGGVKDFVAAALEGSLPSDWTEKVAQDDTGTSHTVCTFTMTMDQVRALGSEQRSLETLGSVPDDVHFFQRVADIPGFTGIERVSRQPTEIASQLYAPTELYQTSHPDAADARGTTFTEADVLDTTGLTLV